MKAPVMIKLLDGIINKEWNYRSFITWYMNYILIQIILKNFLGEKGVLDMQRIINDGEEILWKCLEKIE